MIKNIAAGTTGTYENELKKLRLAFEESDALIIGTGSGLSASAGYEFAVERLKKHFGDFVNKYGMTDMYTGCFADFETYETLKKMMAEARDMRIPAELIPHCTKCGREMDFNLFWDDTFVRDEGWHTAHDRYEEYLSCHETERILYLELGVGFNSPGVIKHDY